jgi:hypothetical protein
MNYISTKQLEKSNKHNLMVYGQTSWQRSGETKMKGTKGNENEPALQCVA